MHQRNGRKYVLELVILGDSERIAKFMEGATIIESRINRHVTAVESHLVKSIEYIFSDAHLLLPTDVMYYIEHDHPSFMIRQEGLEYVVTIDPLTMGWSLLKVTYIN